MTNESKSDSSTDQSPLDNRIREIEDATEGRVLIYDRENDAAWLSARVSSALVGEVR